MNKNPYLKDRDLLISYVRDQLVGPAGGVEEKLEDAPHKRYLMGTLFPAAARVDDSDRDSESLNNDFKPSSMAISFAADADLVCKLEIEAGQYKKGQDFVWQRSVLSEVRDISLNRGSVQDEKIFDGKARLDVSVRSYGGGKVVTVAISNIENSGERLDPSKCLYQSGIKISVVSGAIREYPSSDRFKLDDEQKQLAMTYRKRVPWAVGHGVSVDWRLGSDKSPVVLKTESMPCHSVKGFSTDLDYKKYHDLDEDILSIAAIADTESLSTDNLLDGYKKLINAYRSWIDELDEEVLDSRYSDAKKSVIAKLRMAAERMDDGIRKLKQSETAMLAFRLANKAMLMQMIHSGSKFAGTVRQKNWGYTAPDYLSEEVKRTFKWRPFQLAFQLLVLESIIPDEQGNYPPTHDEVDLLWFPTGGGKTEAYLAVAAWEMLFRRLKYGSEGEGTAVIKRYTLRLLTSQQFQRAGSLICALESMRTSIPELGESEFSLGLWAGEGSTPNDFKKAHTKFNTQREAPKPENSFQLQSCPWCGTSIFPEGYSDESDDYGIRCDDSHFEFFCPSQDCEFHDSLPIQVVDEGLYKKTPSMLIGTVDKFARLTWKAEASIFFGDSRYLPPSLIIQDELHLISGPLGTIAGIYEAGFDTAMERLGRRPKVIAATATIRSAAQQSNRLFGRSVNIFPPSGTDEADSFFSKEDSDSPGRLYVGVMPSGHTGQTALVQAAAALLQAPEEKGFADTLLDSYWTLPIYHNSRRELSKTMTLSRDDIPERIKVISDTPRQVDTVEELSANVEGARIPEVLKNLEKGLPDAVDILPCTNMISVGVDIERLGNMIINGQPKATAEYIQASSRVGRKQSRPPGIVLTLYSPSKPRDRSHYESFKNYHQALYRYVEPTSVTPWALPAMERAMHAALIAAVRVSGYLRDNQSAKNFDRNNSEFKEIYKSLVERISRAMEGVTEKEKKTAFDYLDSLVEEWSNRVSEDELTHYEANKSGKQFKPLIQAFESQLKDRAWPTLNSMRNVDTETNLFVRGEDNV
ncbi:hypothetical protein CS022_18165 [Veronia nyctiphanis]|uniref:Helicase C-terminal domain-containing protein n=2 Tax=Veronia nyctiphanis TaxID=1278244 RepID=A0A4Q0YSH0_9GAMM|nr:hypothetical protein CS022_18070 [Veronia nyctiphanis]RXJ72054.1 hypothetical protein CS022_18165 [Veronia nyctiphanis]